MEPRDINGMSPSWWRKRLLPWLLPACLLILGFLAYSNSFQNSFHFDDFRTILHNRSIRDLGNVRAVWNYWPNRFVAFLSIAANYRLNGTDVFGYHVFNFAVHLGAAILVGWLAALTLRGPALKKEIKNSHVAALALFAGAVFFLHPLQTQAVNLIVQRGTLLAAFFYLLSVCLYIKAGLSRDSCPSSWEGKVCYAGSLLAAFLSFFSKEMAVSLPLAIVLCDLFLLKTPQSRLWKLIAPFFVLSLSVPLTMAMTKSVNFKGMHRIAEDEPGISCGHYLLTQLRVMVTYLRLTLFPLRQNFDYDYPVIRSFFQGPPVPSLLLLVTVAAAAWRAMARYRLVSFGIFWFFLTLLPESSVIPIKDLIVEHRLYLPLAGFSFFLVGGAYYLLKRRTAILTALLLIVVCYAALTHQRNKVWKDEVSLWSDVIRKSPSKARAYSDRGHAYHVRGDLDLALNDYSKALELGPDLVGTYYNRGIVYQLKGDLEDALRDYDKAIEIFPEYKEALYNRAVVFFQKGEYAKSREDLRRAQALGLKPDPRFVEGLARVPVPAAGDEREEGI